MKKNLYISVIAIFSILAIYSLSFAQQESVTITTYYPSPYGSYKELRAQRIAIGSTYYDSASHPWNEGSGTCFANEICNAALVVEGNVGIGTRSPGGQGSGAPGPYLNVLSTSTSGSSEVYIGGAGTAANTPIGAYGFVTIGTSAGDKRAAFIAGALDATSGTTPNGRLVFWTRSDTAFSEKMRITREGYVGIGTTGPTERLHVAGSGANILLDGGGGGGWFKLKGTNSTSYSAIYVLNKGLAIQNFDASGIYFGTDTAVGGAITRMVILDNGKVGIGTTTPGYTLTVNGTTWCTSGAWAGSDSRWTRNVRTLVNPLEKVQKLRGVTFDWKVDDFKNNHFPEGKQIGLVAQELEKEFPELVTTDEDGYKAIAYDRFTAVLLEAVKAQQQQIELLKAEIANLKKKP
jgi:hypothetical protein